MALQEEIETEVEAASATDDKEVEESDTEVQHVDAVATNDNDDVFSSAGPSSPTVTLDGESAFSGGVAVPRIPYIAMYHSSEGIMSQVSATCYLPKVPLKVKIVDATRDLSYKHPINPYLYKLEVTHGPFSWTVQRRYKDFTELNDKLWSYKTTLKIPLPNKKHMERRRTVRGYERDEAKMPHFPRRPDALITLGDQLEKRKDQLETWLNAMMEVKMYRDHHITRKFFEISKYSFVDELGTKSKEGVVKKQTGSHVINLDCCGKLFNFPLRNIFVQWHSRWFLLKDTFLAYMDENKKKFRGLLLFDGSISITHERMRHTLVISNQSRRLKLYCWTERKALEWMEAIEYNVKHRCCGLTQTDIRLNSFAPVREDCYSTWYVDGGTYMSAVADAMEVATEEIFITDWWLSPQVYMKRNYKRTDDYWRLDQILKRKAEQGVKIYVQVYKEVKGTVTLQSLYAKQTLQALHPTNIKVMRHPDITGGDSLLWAHHEKLVIIDQMVAFVSGIDLCYGRWDDHHHRLTDQGPNPPPISQTSAPRQTRLLDTLNTQQKPKAAVGMIGMMPLAVVDQASMNPAEAQSTSPSVPKQNGRTGGFRNRIAHRMRSIHMVKRKQHDKRTEEDGGGGDKTATENANLSGTSTANHPTSPTEKKHRISFSSIVEKAHRNRHAHGSKEPPPQSVFIERYKEMVENVGAGQQFLWAGKDYSNDYLEGHGNLEDAFSEMLDRNTEPRMPWHDIASVTHGVAARDAARHFIQRWNFTKEQKAKKGERVNYLLPKSYENVTVPKDRIMPGSVKATVQILRSSSEWSAGLYDTERSIQNGYLYAIEKSQHFIYIENQFFVSCMDSTSVQNSIVDALFRRIVRAHTSGEKFRVYVCMPLLPGMTGNITKRNESGAIRAVLHWQYQSINRGPGSLLGKLDQAIGTGNHQKYISFCGLRQKGELNGKPITEILYIHSKMLIVDDRITIIGSANINDRSMTGFRDSEVCLMVEDTEFTQATMDGKPYEVGVYSAALRRRVFAEHLGYLPDDYDPDNYDPLTDPSCETLIDVAGDSFYKDVWLKRASINTTVYDKVFRVAPSDMIRKWTDVDNFQKGKLCDSDPEAARTELEKVQGFLVFFPLFFLIEEDLQPEALSKEGLAPTDLWV